MPSTYVSLRIPADLLEHTRERAELEDRSVSSVIRQAVRTHVVSTCACLEPVLSGDDGRWCARCRMEIKQ